jgi:hypothetical protein
VRIGFTRNGAVNTVTTSKIGFEQKPKYLERNPLRLKQRYGRQEQGSGSVKASVAHRRRFHQGHPFSSQNPGREGARSERREPPAQLILCWAIEANSAVAKLGWISLSFRDSENDQNRLISPNAPDVRKPR